MLDKGLKRLKGLMKIDCECIDKILPRISGWIWNLNNRLIITLLL